MSTPTPFPERDALVAEAMRLADDMAYKLAQSWVAQGFGSGVSKAESTRKEARELLRAHLVNRLGALAAVQPVPTIPKRPWPNHNWCVNCSPENCSGCGTEPVERRVAQQEPQR